MASLFQLRTLLIITSIIFLSFTRQARVTNDYITSRQAKTESRKHVNISNNQYPKVFTSLINKDIKSSIDFVQEVDLIDEVIHYENESHNKITFLVHSQREFEYLSDLINSLEITIEMQEDSELTKEFQNVPVENFSKKHPFSISDKYYCYRNLASHYATLDDLSARSVPNLSVQVKDIGPSYLKSQNEDRGYQLKVLQITSSKKTPNKSIFFAMAGMHPREYSPPELIAKFAEMLIDQYPTDPNIASLLSHTEIHLLFQSNPDGREEAEAFPKRWRRKNMHRSNKRNFQCGPGEYGIDLNRNFPFRWGTGGSSNNPCAETYRGEYAASEPETSAVVNYLSSIFPVEQQRPDESQIDVPYPEDTTGVFMDVHAYGEITIWPWGHENKTTPNDEGMEATARKFQYWNGYTLAGPKHPEFLYVASGVTDDYAYGSLGAAAFTLELGTKFYQDCDGFLEKVLPKNLPVLLYAASIAKAPYSMSKGPDVMDLVLSSSNIIYDDSAKLTVTAVVSDDAMLSEPYPTGEQSIKEVLMFIDEHPFDENPAPIGIPMTLTDANTATITLKGDELFRRLGGSIYSKHVLHVQAMDKLLYKGPVRSIYFRVRRSRKRRRKRPGNKEKI